jgi:hypothetical protein
MARGSSTSAAARGCSRRGCWRHAGAPRTASIHGIELKGADVARAIGALGSRATTQQGDIRFADFGRADVVVILDVLHYLDYADQDAVLARVRAALPPDGRLLLRVGDAARGMAFRISTWVDRLVMLGRGHGCVRLHCRPLAAWREALGACGFESAPLPASAGTPFANVLLLAHAA